MEEKRECKNCFCEMQENESVCPRCGYPVEPVLSEREIERQKKVKVCSAARLAVKIALIVLVTAATALTKILLGHTSASWWWAAGALAIGVIVSFITIYITEIVIWYKSVRPYAEEKSDD